MFVFHRSLLSWRTEQPKSNNLITSIPCQIYRISCFFFKFLRYQFKLLSVLFQEKNMEEVSKLLEEQVRIRLDIILKKVQNGWITSPEELIEQFNKINLGKDRPTHAKAMNPIFKRVRNQDPETSNGKNVNPSNPASCLLYQDENCVTLETCVVCKGRHGLTAEGLSAACLLNQQKQFQQVNLLEGKKPTDRITSRRIKHSVNSIHPPSDSNFDSSQSSQSKTSFLNTQTSNIPNHGFDSTHLNVPPCHFFQQSQRDEPNQNESEESMDSNPSSSSQFSNYPFPAEIQTSLPQKLGTQHSNSNNPSFQIFFSDPFPLRGEIPLTYQAEATLPSLAASNAPNLFRPPFPNLLQPNSLSQAGFALPNPSGPFPNQPGVHYPNQAGVLYPNEPVVSFPNQPGSLFPSQPGFPFPNQAYNRFPNQHEGFYPNQPCVLFPNQDGLPFPNQPGIRFPNPPVFPVNEPSIPFQSLPGGYFPARPSTPFQPNLRAPAPYGPRIVSNDFSKPVNRQTGVFVPDCSLEPKPQFNMNSSPRNVGMGRQWRGIKKSVPSKLNTERMMQVRMNSKPNFQKPAAMGKPFQTKFDSNHANMAMENEESKKILSEKMKKIINVNNDRVNNQDNDTRDEENDQKMTSKGIYFSNNIENKAALLPSESEMFVFWGNIQKDFLES